MNKLLKAICALLLMTAPSMAVAQNEGIGDPLKSNDFIPKPILFGAGMEFDYTDAEGARSIVEEGAEPGWGGSGVNFEIPFKEPAESRFYVRLSATVDDSKKHFEDRMATAERSDHALQPVEDYNGSDFFIAKAGEDYWHLCMQVENVVFSIYHRQMRSIPDPEGWLKQKANAYRIFLRGKLNDEELRTWTGSNGKSFDGTLQEFDADTASVSILRPDGMLFQSIPIRSLSKGDIEYLREWYSKQ